MTHTHIGTYVTSYMTHTHTHTHHELHDAHTQTHTHHAVHARRFNPFNATLEYHRAIHISPTTDTHTPHRDTCHQLHTNYIDRRQSYHPKRISLWSVPVSRAGRETNRNTAGRNPSQEEGRVFVIHMIHIILYLSHTHTHTHSLTHRCVSWGHTHIPFLFLTHTHTHICVCMIHMRLHSVCVTQVFVIHIIYDVYHIILITQTLPSYDTHHIIWYDTHHNMMCMIHIILCMIHIRLHTVCVTQVFEYDTHRFVWFIWYTYAYTHTHMRTARRRYDTSRVSGV